MKKPVSVLFKLILTVSLALLSFLFILRALSVLPKLFPSLQRFLTQAVTADFWGKTGIGVAVVFILLVVPLLVITYRIASRLVTALLRAFGRDPHTYYRHCSQLCDEALRTSANSSLQLGRPVLPVDRAKNIYQICEIAVVCAVVFLLVLIRLGGSLGGIILGLLAVLGALLFYLLLWVLVKIFCTSDMRIRKIRK